MQKFGIELGIQFDLQSRSRSVRSSIGYFEDNNVDLLSSTDLPFAWKSISTYRGR